jgi:hypothetical protein
VGKTIERHPERVAGSELWFLQDLGHPSVPDALADSLGAVSDDHHDIVWAGNPQGEINHVIDQRPTRELVQDLGGGGSHPRSFSGSQDNDAPAGFNSAHGF